MQFYRWILLILFSVNGLSTAIANECIPQPDMAEIGRDFKQFKDLTHSEFCLDGTPESNLLVGIYFMRKTSFTTPMKNSEDDLFSGAFSSDWYKYFTGRIKDIVIDRNCPEGVGAYVRGWGSSTMWVCSMLLTDSFVGIDRASVFMHEARHIDGYPHTTCNKGPRAGIRGACDRKISDGGSYAVSVETYAQLGRYALNLHPALKAYSKAAAVVYADEAFAVQTVVDRKAHFLALTQEREFYKIDLGALKKSQQLGSTPHLGHVVMRGQFMMMFPDDKALKAGYILAHNEGTLPHQPRGFVKKYNENTPAQKALLLDAHIGGNWSAQVQTNELLLICSRDESIQPEKISYQGETPQTVIYLNGYKRSHLSAHLLMKSGQIYEFGCSNKRGFIKLTRERLDQNYKRVYKSGKIILGLSPDGNLFEINGQHSTKITTAIDGRIYDIAPTEDFNFFDAN